MGRGTNELHASIEPQFRTRANQKKSICYSIYSLIGLLAGHAAASTVIGISSNWGVELN